MTKRTNKGTKAIVKTLKAKTTKIIGELSQTEDMQRGYEILQEAKLDFESLQSYLDSFTLDADDKVFLNDLANRTMAQQRYTQFNSVTLNNVLFQLQQFLELQQAVGVAMQDYFETATDVEGTYAQILSPKCQEYLENSCSYAHGLHYEAEQALNEVNQLLQPVQTGRAHAPYLGQHIRFAIKQLVDFLESKTRLPMTITKEQTAKSKGMFYNFCVEFLEQTEDREKDKFIFNPSTYVETVLSEMKKK